MGLADSNTSEVTQRQRPLAAVAAAAPHADQDNYHEAIPRPTFVAWQAPYNVPGAPNPYLPMSDGRVTQMLMQTPSQSYYFNSGLDWKQQRQRHKMDLAEVAQRPLAAVSAPHADQDNYHEEAYTQAP